MWGHHLHNTHNIQKHPKDKAFPESNNDRTSGLETRTVVELWMSSLRINSTHCNISAKVNLPTILSEFTLLLLLVKFGWVACTDFNSIPYFCQVSVLWVSFGKMGRWHWQWHWQGKADFETDRCKNGRHKWHWADSIKSLSVWQNWKSDIDKAKLILKLIVVEMECTSGTE